MEMIVSTNGGHCHIERCDNIVCPECSGKKFKFDPDDVWVGHDKLEAFMIIRCQECGKKLDLSLDIE